MSFIQNISQSQIANIIIIFQQTQLEVVAGSSTIGLKKYCPTSFQRITLAICHHLLTNADDFLFIFEPETLKRWWNELETKPSNPKTAGKAGRPPIPDNIKDYIFLLKSANMNFGYKRISGELLKLGLSVSPSSVRNILKNLPFDPFYHNKNSWNSFLNDYKKDIIATDFIKFYSPRSNQYYFLLLFINHANKEILHFNTTEHPTKKWIENQLRHINDGSSKKYLVRDNDILFQYIDFEKFNVEDTPISFLSPNMNSIAERVIRTFKNETSIESEEELTLDKIHFAFSEFHKYYNNYRVHQGIDNLTIPQFNKGQKPVTINIKDLFWLDILTKVKKLTFLNGKLKHYYIE